MIIKNYVESLQYKFVHDLTTFCHQSHQLLSKKTPIFSMKNLESKKMSKCNKPSPLEEPSLPSSQCH